MCGIIGYTAKNKQSVTSIFKKKSKEILDRGTYFDSILSQNECYGYSRLPTDGVQISGFNGIKKNKSRILLYNGLITNVDYLCDAYSLSSQARKFDTTCLLEGFSAQGEEFISRCRGMFAFAYIAEEKIILVRDTVGIKPLYFEDSGDFFAFSSEKKGLSGIGKIQEVLPGEIIVYNKKEKKVTHGKFSYKSYKKYSKNELYACLRESIITPTKRYLAQSKKNIALLLSGGVDSSLIAKILIDNLSQSEKKRIRAFSLGDKRSKDLSTAQKLAKELRLRMVIVKPYMPRESIKKLSHIVYAVESPYARVVKVALLQDALAKEIKKRDIDIVISGEGADELFFGYERFINGLIPKQIENLFDLFYSNVFYYTLLQRYDRIFARSQIEGRVPFLDQELIELAKRFTTREKISSLGVSYNVKIPLRDMAKQIGLPTYISQREKEKMTHGVTGKDNKEEKYGYLEKEARILTGETMGELIRRYYSQLFTGEENCGLMTEERLMDLARKYRKQNSFSLKGVRP